MATAVETLEKLERRITLTVPVAEVNEEVEKRAYREIPGLPAGQGAAEDGRRTIRRDGRKRSAER